MRKCKAQNEKQAKSFIYTNKCLINLPIFKLFTLAKI